MKFFKQDTEKKEKRKAAAKQRAKRSASRGARPDPRKPLSVNTVIEGYLIDKVIGRGSFSLVYSAIEQDTGKEVVIKEYYPKHFAKRADKNTIVPMNGQKLFTFSEGFKQFFNEAMTLNKICHPNVLKTHNIFRTNKTAYLISLNKGGRDLKWFLSAVREPMDQALIYKIFMPILSALNFLHDAELLHLDIKPANILLLPSSESLLLDFGAAQAMSSSKRINRMQTLTHGFAPPEQYDRNRALGPWTDIYAVAATLFFGIACKPPVKSKDSKVESHLDIRKFKDNYNRKVIYAVNRALSYDASKRYVNVDEFAQDLLVDSKWQSLREFELDVMKFDRFEAASLQSQHDLAEAVA